MPLAPLRAPGLPSENLDLAPPQIHEVQPQPQTVAVAADGGIGGNEAQEVRLQVAQHLRVAELRIEPQSDARVLRAEPRLGQSALRRVAEGNAARAREIVREVTQGAPPKL